jgi:BRCT domain type II-containing protein
MTLRTPNSGAQLDQIAPSDAVARNATIVSGTLGRKAATRSPRPTPSPRSPAAQRSTCSRSSPHVTSAGATSSRACTRATASEALPARICSA